jgi:hypothetical protein
MLLNGTSSRGISSMGQAAGSITCVHPDIGGSISASIYVSHTVKTAKRQAESKRSPTTNDYSQAIMRQEQPEPCSETLVISVNGTNAKFWNVAFPRCWADSLKPQPYFAGGKYLL